MLNLNYIGRYFQTQTEIWEKTRDEAIIESGFSRTCMGSVDRYDTPR